MTREQTQRNHPMITITNLILGALLPAPLAALHAND
jgi:hypothetical protein